MFACLLCNDDNENSQKTCSFEPVDNTIDEQGHPVPDSFFDSFEGSNKDDKETTCCSVPEWHQTDEDDMETRKWREMEEPKKKAKLEEEWIEVKHTKIGRCKTKKALIGNAHSTEGLKTHTEAKRITRDRTRPAHTQGQ